MANGCKMVVFSDKAYNAIIRETFEWDPVETGGILLGHILDNGCWIVMEVLPPGYSEGREGDNVHHEMGYFEYNQRFVNYLANSVATQYKIPLELLGLWHRHPGSMNFFSTTDDGTNKTFASQNPNGAISGLVNVDPKLRMTMYYIHHNDTGMGRPNYLEVDVEVGSDLIPEEYFEMQYYGGENDDLHPYAPQRGRNTRQGTLGDSNNDDINELNINRIINEQIGSGGHIHHPQEVEVPWFPQLANVFDQLKKNKLLGCLFFILIIAILYFSIKMFWQGIQSVLPDKPVWELFDKGADVNKNQKRTKNKVPKGTEREEEEIVLINSKIELIDSNPHKIETKPDIHNNIRWESLDPKVVKINAHGYLQAVTNGEATVKAVYGKQTLECHITVQLPSHDEKIPDVEIDNGQFSESCSLPLSQSHQLGLKCKDSNFDLHQLVWKSKDATIVQVNENGKVTAMAEGTTSVCICFNEIELDSIRITVKPKKQ